MIIPTKTQVENSKTWFELYSVLNISTRNRKAQKPVQDYVRQHFPDSVLTQKRYGRITDLEFIELVKNCKSIRQVILEGGWKQAGGTYAMIHQRIRRLGLDISHFTGQAHSKGKIFSNRNQPIENYLVVNCFSINSHKLKERLIRENYKTHKCEICNITEWQNKPTPIELDHINGDHYDNRLENLRIICPNCHAQTLTYRGKKVIKIKELCPHCSNPKKANSRVTCGSKQCLSKQTGQYRNHLSVNKTSAKVINRPTKISWPSKEELEKLVWSCSTTKIAIDLGVSDVAISKRCKKFGISKPPRGYWTQQLYPSPDLHRDALSGNRF